MNNFDLDKTLSTMKILCDSREKPTKEAKKRWDAFGVPYRIEALQSGDYSAEFTLPNGEILEFKEYVVIERKQGLTEICGNFCQNRDRFIREFERIKKAGTKVYLIIEDASWENAYNGKYRPNMHPKSLIASLTAWMARYDAHIIFCKSETFPRLARDILYREAKEFLQNM